MPKKKPSPSGNRPKLAKLSPPRLRWAAPRERLFRRLDDAAHGVLVWISGPPGAGKTSVIASWLDATGRPNLWYQADVIDLDVASTFHYLALHAEALAPGVVLPRLTPDYDRHQEAFARRFFRRFFAALPDASVLVLDNFQEAAASLEPLLAVAIEEAPAGITLIVASRTAPGVTLARAFAHQQAVHITPAELVLDAAEAELLAASHAGALEETVRAAFAASGGWAAGFMLILERAAHPEDRQSPEIEGAQQALFDYIASLLYQDVSDAGRRALALAALLPRFTLPEARTLSPETDPGPLVDHLYSRCLFTARRDSDEPVYEFHALLRAFLLAQLRRLLPAAELKQAKERAARILEADAQYESALALYQDAGNWQAAEHLLTRVADAWLGQGRHRMIAEVIRSMPSRLLEVSGPLLRLFATALLPLDQPKSRALAIRAYERFEESGQYEGRILSAVTVIDTFLGNFSEYSEARGWAQRIADALYAPGASTLASAVRAEALSAFLASAALCDTDHDALEDAATEVSAFVLDPSQTDEARMNLGVRLLTYCAAVRSFVHVERVRGALLELAERPTALPFRIAWCWMRYAQSACMYRSHAEALAYLRRAASIAREHRLSTLLSLALMWQVLVLSFDGDGTAVASLRDEMAASVDPQRPFEVGNLALTELLDLRSRDMMQGRDIRNIQKVIDMGDRLNSMWICLSYRSIALHAMALHAPAEEVERVAEETRALASGTRYWRYVADAEIVRLYCRLTRSDPVRAVERMRAVLPQLVGSNPYVAGPWAREVYGAVLRRAVAEGIAPAWTEELGKVLGISAALPEQIPGSAVAVRIRVLGPLDVEVGAVSLTSNIRRSQKVGQLLALLASLGPAPVLATRISDALWPEADGDKANHALKVTIHRLRRLLGRNDIVVVEGGRIGLDSAQVWVDAWVFGEMCARLRRSSDVNAAHSELPTFESMHSLYRGALLEGADHDWAIEPRRRLRQGFEQVERLIGARES